MIIVACPCAHLSWANLARMSAGSRDHFGDREEVAGVQPSLLTSEAGMGIPGREAATCTCPAVCQNGGFAGLISQNRYPLLPATRQDARLSRYCTSMISGRPS